MPKFAVMVLVVAALTLIVGCSAGESLGVATAEIQPHVRVVSSAEATEVTVVLYQRTTIGLLQLSEGDVLSASLSGGASVVMALRDAGSVAARYTASLPAAAVGGEVVIALERSVGESAPATRMTIPPAPVVLAPEPGASAPSGQPFTVSWVPFSGGGVEVRFAPGPCPELPDDEQALVDVIVALPGLVMDGMLGTTEVTFLTGSDLACEADLLVGRVTSDIDLDPAFAGLRADPRVVREAQGIPMTFEAAP